MTAIKLTDAEVATLRDSSVGDSVEFVFGTVESIVAARVAEALRDAADNAFMDESLTGRTAMVRTNEAWRLLLKTLAAEYEPRP